MNDIAVKIEDLHKEYRLGTIGGGTLQADLQSWWARKNGKEDPNLKIGAKSHNKNETFTALNGINLEVRKGDALGIIGGNGAGKSTLLKILSRVTAPTKGSVSISGKISSMLEVGTGFNPELTGRENIYLNGAILGMTKEEVNSKIAEIIAFSECERFIDTPVKRYSSGMYVKLAFAVAAHLDSEILVMDEVLAVGDMQFQQKCLGKMGDIADREGRTILYVSHNMNTIQQLCNRVVVLDHGTVKFNGSVDEGIKIYLNADQFQQKRINDVFHRPRPHYIQGKDVVRIKSIELTEQKITDQFKFILKWENFKNVDNLKIRLEIKNLDHTRIATALSSEVFECKKGIDSEQSIIVDISKLQPGKYELVAVLYQINEFGTLNDLDLVFPTCIFEKENDGWHKEGWTDAWGSIRLPNMVVL